MRVLVTGGAGFVGSHVVEALVTQGHDAVVLDRAAPSWPDPGARYVLGDVRDASAWEGAMAGVDAVSHQAARVGLGVDFTDITDYVDDNDSGTATGLLVMHRLGFKGRIVLASSMVVYGEGRYRCGAHGVVRAGPRDPERLDAGCFEPPCPTCGTDLVAEAVEESAPTDPRNVYAATKLHQEHLCVAFAREHGSTTVALRYHNVYGPRMPRDTPYAGVASIFRSEILAARPAQVFEDGRQTRDFVHVTDVARANVLALTAPLDSGFAAFNICSGVARTVGELAQAMSRGVPPVLTGKWRPGDVRHVFASPAKAWERLGFRATTGFTDGLASLRE